MISNKSLINAFIDGNCYTNSRNGSMCVQHDRLYSYNTCIAERALNGVIYVNTTKYSQTTSKQQSLLVRLLNDNGISYKKIGNLPWNVTSIAKYHGKTLQ